MKKIHRALAGVAAVALSLAAFTAGDIATGNVAPAVAQDAPATPQGAAAGRKRFNDMLMSLNLSPAQQTQIKEIMRDARAKSQTLTDRDAKRANMRAAYAKVEAALSPPQRQKLQAERDALRAQHRGDNPNHP
jgi:Spy/CpxP family protein refolding chaperone